MLGIVIGQSIRRLRMKLTEIMSAGKLLSDVKIRVNLETSDFWIFECMVKRLKVPRKQCKLSQISIGKPNAMIVDSRYALIHTESGHILRCAQPGR